MNKYMKELKQKVTRLCASYGIAVEYVRVRGSVALVYVPSESKLEEARKLNAEIRQMIDLDGAGYKDEFNAYEDMWTKREGYMNTRGIEAEVQFTTLKWGV